MSVPNPNPNAVPVTEEGRSWTIYVCAKGCTLVGNPVDAEKQMAMPCFACGGLVDRKRVSESSKLRAVEAERDRWKDAFERVERALTGPDVQQAISESRAALAPEASVTEASAEKLGDWRRSVGPPETSFAPSPGREGRDGGTDDAISDATEDLWEMEDEDV